MESPAMWDAHFSHRASKAILSAEHLPYWADTNSQNNAQTFCIFILPSIDWGRSWGKHWVLLLQQDWWNSARNFLLQEACPARQVIKAAGHRCQQSLGISVAAEEWLHRRHEECQSHRSSFNGSRSPEWDSCDSSFMMTLSDKKRWNGHAQGCARQPF